MKFSGIKYKSIIKYKQIISQYSKVDLYFIYIYTHTHIYMYIVLHD